jgi:hypothetical protein
MQYRNAISSMEGMLDIFTGLRKIREHIPVREAVSGVVNERREFVRGCSSLGPTSVCLMQEAAYCHRYLVYVSRCTPVNMHSGRTSRRELGLSHLYVAAEGEVQSYLVDTLENLLSIGRSLFGTAQWLTGPLSVQSAIDPDDEPEGHHG